MLERSPHCVRDEHPLREQHRVPGVSLGPQAAGEDGEASCKTWKISPPKSGLPTHLRL